MGQFFSLIKFFQFVYPHFIILKFYFDSCIQCYYSIFCSSFIILLGTRYFFFFSIYLRLCFKSDSEILPFVADLPFSHIVFTNFHNLPLYKYYLFILVLLLTYGRFNKLFSKLIFFPLSCLIIQML